MAHDFTLPRRDDKSLIPRLLYKNSYWLVKWESWKTAMLFCLCLCIFIDVLPQFCYLSLLICQCCIIQLRISQLEFSELNEYRIQLQLTLQHFNRELFVLKPFLSWQKIIVRQATCNSHRMSVIVIVNSWSVNCDRTGWAFLFILHLRAKWDFSSETWNHALCVYESCKDARYFQVYRGTITTEGRRHP